MNEKKTDRHRYWLTYLLDDFPVGATFGPEVLHINIIPWFVIEMDEGELIASFYKSFSDQKAFDVVVGDNAQLGELKDASVDLVGPEKALINLHKKGLAWFERLGARWALKDPYVGEEYIPHIRRRGGKQLQKGQKLHLDSLTLVKALRRPDNVRIVAAKAEFHED